MTRHATLGGSDPGSAMLPVNGAWVCRSDGSGGPGRVIGHHANGKDWVVQVDWFSAGVSAHPAAELRCGLRPGYVVQDVPASALRTTLGPATVLSTRRLAGAEQALVQVHASGQLVWLPYQSLTRIMDPELQFRRGEMHSEEAGERFALKLMGHALRSWNEATGALDRLDVDPLPHQIQLVHRILSSGRTNWIIADDVGLGKTIEVGLLLAGLERRNRLRRVLIVTPASLTRQWQDELKVKFDREYEIYGEDFGADEAWKWKLHDRVIASLDLIKPRAPDDRIEADSHFTRLMLAERWDLVVFDEAHRLSRSEHDAQTLRYRLAVALRQRSDALLLLTGTPHQGDEMRFRHLLQLVRPELTPQISRLENNPEIIGDIVLRNRKLDVTDAEGNFIFKGQTVRRFEVASCPESIRLERELTEYFRQGYMASERVGGAKGRAIGFVMTIYRKLASSSYKALHVAIDRRLAKLQGRQERSSPPEALVNSLDGLPETDQLELTEVVGTAESFFTAELALLIALNATCMEAIRADRKIRHLYKDIIQKHVQEAGEKVLIFTEYRATQDFVARMIEQLTGKRVALINGSQSLQEKLANVALFDAEAPVLVSTEAGGEGLNLHRRCHVLVNYDLPWNPARLVQRIGRLYRYGQTKRVVVLHLLSRDTIDNKVLSIALTKVEAIAHTLASVGSEFRDGYEEDVLGSILEELDLEEVMRHAQTDDLTRSEQRINEAVDRARSALSQQAEILNHAERFDPTALQRLGNFTTEALARFIARASGLVGVQVETHADAERLTLRLPDSLRGRFAEFRMRKVIEATTCRRRWDRTSTLHLLDFHSEFVRRLIDAATAPDAGGGYAAVNGAWLQVDTVGAYLSRWQNDQGEVLSEELLVLTREPQGKIVIDNSVVLKIFDRPLLTLQASPTPSPAARTERLSALRRAVESSMEAQLSPAMQPNDLVPLAFAEFAASSGDA